MRKTKGRVFQAEGIECVKDPWLEKMKELLEREEDLGWLEYRLR